MKKSYFDKNRFFIIDGGMGTSLAEYDCPGEYLNITNPDAVFAVQRNYVESGAQILTANSFGANRLKLAGTPYTTEEIVKASISIARKAADGKALVSLDIGPTGALLAPMGNLPFEEAYDIFAEIVRAGEEADTITIETMTDTYELKAAVLAAKENANKPIIATVSIDENGKLICGADIPAVVALLEGLGVDALGFNCGFGPDQFREFFPILRKYTSIPIALLPNAGLPHVVDGKTVYDTSPSEFAAGMREFAMQGALLLGGCCGTTPAHIRAMVDAVKDVSPSPLTEKNYTIVSSWARSQILGDAPVIIGERINPTGKKKLKEALRDDNIEYLLKEGISQADAGAHILDVNVGLPEIDESAMMKKAVFELQSILPLPLCIDSSSPEVLEAALRIYNGKPVINSVNGKQEVMDAVLPIAAKYGGVLVALTIDEDGIPDTAEGRFKIAEKIVREAAKYNISQKDIMIDCLTLTVSSDINAAKTTLDAVKMIKERLGLCTVLGVSNVSFGLPNREKLNSSFLTQALLNGLSCAIMNPLSDEMLSAFLSYNALHALDEGFSKYIESCGIETKAAESKAKDADTLDEIIFRGLKNESYAKTQELLHSEKPLDVINEYIIPALDRTGAEFEAKRIFLPHLLAAAETAKNAFTAITDFVGPGEAKGEKILLATVQGDIHDIGKNIVSLLLSTYGFDVVDLGRDVAPEEIVRTAEEQNIRLVGLSALMTTTVASMERTIEALRRSPHSCKIMVGGAVLNQEYADAIGADFYGKDALASVNYAKKILN